MRVLAHIQQEPLLNLELLNPELVKHSESMAQVHSLRNRLRLLGDYLLTCRSGAYKHLQKKSVFLSLSDQIGFRIPFYQECGSSVVFLSLQNGEAHIPVGVKSPVQHHGSTAGSSAACSSRTASEGFNLFFCFS